MLPADQDVVLKLYDVQGRELRTLANRRQSAGTYRVDLSAGGLPSGVYLYRLETGSTVRQRKLVVQR